MTAYFNEDDLLERSCPGCGAPESQWFGFESKGFVGNDGELHCCETCTRGQTCSCNTERLESLVKKHSA